jgi:hypothetical protein
LNINALLSSSYFPRQADSVAQTRNEAVFTTDSVGSPKVQNPFAPENGKFEAVIESEELMTELLRVHFTSGGLLGSKK